MPFSKGVGSGAEIIALPDVGLDADLQELQGAVRHIVTQLERLKAEDALLNKHGVEKEFLVQLERLAQEDLLGIDDQRLDEWRQEADAAVEKLFPLLQEAREIHQVKQDRIKNLRERHNLHEVERLDELVLELLPPSVSIEKRLEIRKKRDVLKKGTRLSKEYRAAKDSTNAPAFCEFESEDGERMGGVSKELLREGAVAFVPDQFGQSRLCSKITDPVTGEHTWSEFDYNGINKNTKDGAEAIERTNEWVEFLTGKVLQGAVRNLLSEESGIPPEQIIYDNSAANARVGILPGESTVREVVQSWMDMMLDFEVVPITVMRPEEDGTDIASVQENVTYHERVQDEHSPRIAHQLMNNETDWLFDEPPSRWGALLVGQDPEISTEEDMDWASKDPARSLTRAGVLAFLMGDLDGIERNIMFHPVTGRVWKIDNGLSLGVVTGKELPGITNPGDDRPWKEVAKSVPLELMIRHGLELDDEARENVKRLHAEMQSKESKHYACINSMFRHIFAAYGDVIADNRFQEFLERLEMIAAYGKPVGLDKWDQYIPLIENGFTEVEQGVAA